MRLYTLFEAGVPGAVDLYVRGQDAQQTLVDCLRVEPEWRGLLRVDQAELSDTSPKPN